MPRPGVHAGWPLARSAQAAITAVALVDLLRAFALRAHHLDPTAPGPGTWAALASQLSADLYLVAVVLFILWFRRSRRNAEEFKPHTAAYAPGWAAGGWFVPVAMWWIPRRVAVDICRASTDDTTPDPGSSSLVNAWWAAWLAHQGTAVAISWTDHQDSLAVVALVQMLNVSAAVLAVLLIQHITALQRARTYQGHPFGALRPTPPFPGPTAPLPGPVPRSPHATDRPVRKLASHRPPVR
ncbi:DUF4328 domain-containing protein [Peterkaempfera sp. SMS 1(5)a]|uniref:DUF4328 domain-containing protein n=1 Tax=Peterkaempfera podocarpi TaxID=3232308 RepID=UPI0036733EBC